MKIKTKDLESPWITKGIKKFSKKKILVDKKSITNTKSVVKNLLHSN